jgi:MFS transporter, DHA2 family, multidrug resistance protein
MTGNAEPLAGSAPSSNLGSGLTFSPSQIRSLLLGLALATGMEFYTFDSMNLILTDLTGTLGVSSDEASWLLTIYSCSVFLGVPVSIWLAARLGYKRFLISTVALFALTAIGCSTAPSLKIMLVWRALQGVAGAGLIVWWRASIYLLLPKAQRSPSLMRVSTGLYLSSATGLLISGYLTDHYNWRLVFLPDLFLAAAAIWLLCRTFPNLPMTKTERVCHTDWAGLSLLAVWVICLQIILSRGAIDDWLGSPQIRFLTLAGLSAFAGFVYWQHSPNNTHPLLDIKLLSNRHVMASALIGVCTGMILSGSLFVLPEFLRNVDSQSHSATQTGQLICIYALVAAAFRPFANPFIARIGPRKAIAIAICSLICSMLLLNRWLTTGTTDGYFVLPLILYACCLSPLLPAVGSSTVAKIEQNQLLDGVSLYMTFRQLGASLGVALITILLRQRETLHSARLFEHLRQSSIETRGRLLDSEAYLTSHIGHGLKDAHSAAIQLLRDEGMKQAVTLSYADTFLFMAFIGLVALCFIPIIPSATQQPVGQSSKLATQFPSRSPNFSTGVLS